MLIEFVRESLRPCRKLFAKKFIKNRFKRPAITHILIPSDFISKTSKASESLPAMAS